MRKYILFAALIGGLVTNTIAQTTDKDGVIRSIPSLELQPVRELDEPVNVQRNTNSRAQAYKLVSYANQYVDVFSDMLEWYDSGTFMYAPGGALIQADTAKFYTSADTFNVRFRHVYTYDSNGNMLTEVYKSVSDKDPDGPSKTISQFTKTYDGSKNMLTNTVQVWDNGTSALKNYERTTYTYNGSGGMLSVTDQNWDGSSWVNVSRTTYTRDGIYLVSYIEEEWISGGWQNVSRATLTRDGNYNITEQVVEEWETGAWVKTNRYMQTYNSTNDRTTFLYQSWSGTSWVDVQKLEYTYNNAHSITDAKGYYWNNNAWVPTSRNEYAYNGANLQTYWQQSIWNTDSAAYIPYNKSEYVFNGANKEVYHRNYQWYNNRYYVQDSISYRYDGNDNPVVRDFQMMDDGAFGPYQFTYYRYALVEVSDIEEAKNEWNAGIYPNPSTGNTVVRFEMPQAARLNVFVYDVQGRLVSSETSTAVAGSNQLQMPTGDLAPGIYYVQLVNSQSGSGSVLKFLKQ